MYERELRETKPDKRDLVYDIKDLYAFLDQLADISALVYDAKVKAYVPCSREWVKRKCFQHLYRLSR